MKGIARRIPEGLRRPAIRWVVEPTLRARFRARRGGRYRHVYYDETLRQALEGHASRSDISDHLGTIFFHATSAQPRLIVELGTRGGESTRTLLAAAAVNGAQVLSIDVDDCAVLDLPFRERWTFVRDDDVKFGRERFAEWCAKRDLGPTVDVLFVDTSHEYEHTRQEIEAWFPHLSPRAVVLFHDTNMGDGAYARTDRSVGCGWGNDRGVIRALEEHLDRRYDERSFFYDSAGGFHVIHFPHCNGLTVLRRTHSP